MGSTGLRTLPGSEAAPATQLEALSVEPESIGFALLTHAHIDHTGFLPALVRDGFKGRKFCTPPTRDLCEILLPDAARLQQKDAGHANLKRFSKHRPALPLYTGADTLRREIQDSLGYSALVPEYRETVELA